MHGFDRFSARGHFVDHAHIKVAVDRHGQRSRYRCGRHDQYVRRTYVFLPEFRALSYAEAVLFIDHYQSEVVEFHLVFEQGVGADEDM